MGFICWYVYVFLTFLWVGIINLKLTTTLDRATTQSPCYVPLNLEANV